MKKNNKNNPSPSPKVSVIMPTYNGAAFIQESINSVLNQSLKNFELIIINDGSEDPTRSIIKKYRDRRIVYLENAKNQGTPAARNKGIGSAKGEYIAFCDHDDIFLPNHLKILSGYLDSHQNVGLVYADSVFEFTGSKKKRFAYRSADFEKKLLEITGFFIPSETMCRSECFKTVGLFDEHSIIKKHSHEDWDLWLRISDHFPCTHVRQILGKTLIHQSNKSIGANFAVSYAYIIRKRINNLKRKTQKRSYIRDHSINITHNLLHCEHLAIARKMVLSFQRISKEAHVNACWGLCYLYQGNINFAIVQFNKSLGKLIQYSKNNRHFANYSLPLIEASAARAFTCAGNYRKAQRLLENAVLRAPQRQSYLQQYLLPYNHVRQQLVSLYLRLGMYQKAINLSKSCDRSLLHNARGAYCYNKGLYKKAVIEFEKCISHNEKRLKQITSTPDRQATLRHHSLVCYNSGLAHLKLNKLIKARKAFLKALKFNPSFSLARIAIKRITAKTKNGSEN